MEVMDDSLVVVPITRRAQTARTVAVTAVETGWAAVDLIRDARPEAVAAFGDSEQVAMLDAMLRT